MDKGYDDGRVHDECEQRDGSPLVPIRMNHERMGLPSGDLFDRHNPRISRDGERFRTRYKNRVAVEREFGRLTA